MKELAASFKFRKGEICSLTHSLTRYSLLSIHVTDGSIYQPPNTMRTTVFKANYPPTHFPPLPSPSSIIQKPQNHPKPRPSPSQTPPKNKTKRNPRTLKGTLKNTGNLPTSLKNSPMNPCAPVISSRLFSPLYSCKLGGPGPDLTYLRGQLYVAVWVEFETLIFGF